MKLFARLAPRLARFHLPAALLVTLLQRLPAVRVAATAADIVLESPLGAVLKSAVAAAAALGAVHSLAGATEFQYSPSADITGKVGTPLAVAFTITGSPTPPNRFTIGSLPPGLVTDPASAGGQVTAGSVVIRGTPTQAGLFSVSVSGTDGTYALDGFLTFNISTAAATAPSITTQPAGQTATAGATVTFTVVASGTAPLTYQWTKNGGAISGATSASFTIASAQTGDTGSYAVTVTNTAGSATSNAATLTVNAAPTAPAITTQPSNQTVTAGSTATFTVVASGTAPLTYQWSRNGTAISGANSATLTLTNAQSANAGSYTVVVTNSIGSVTSSAATLTVNAVAVAPVFSVQPVSHTMATGSTVVFRALASGTPSYQWRLNGAPISGATSALLVVRETSAASTGAYTCVATNSAGSATSSAATLTLSNSAFFGHLINLSVFTDLIPGESGLSLGTFIGGNGTSGQGQVLVRAAGPTLAAPAPAGFGITSAVPDPQLKMSTNGTIVAQNDNWGGSQALMTAFGSVGAFPYSATNSRDAAATPTVAIGLYSVEVSEVTGRTGPVIAELYDMRPKATFSATTPRLINLSANKKIAAGGSLAAGFYIDGDTSRTVLVRAIGPALGQFGVTGFMADPVLKLSSGADLATNDNWGGDAQLGAVAAGVGGFPINDANSKDAVLLITLAPGLYSATATDVPNVGGTAIVEVYEVP